MLGGGIDHDVGAEVERALVERGGEYVIDDNAGAGGVRHLANRGDIDQVEHRVRRALQEHRVGRRRQRRLPFVQLGAVDEHGLDAPARQDLIDDEMARAEQGARGDHPVAGVELADQRGEHRRHAGGRGVARLGALEFGQPLLEHGDRRVAVA